MNCFERNKEYLKLHPGFNRKPMETNSPSSLRVSKFNSSAAASDDPL